ncbi:ribonuclease III [Devosia chinhatensis]|uniref:Ribonuclease 3 n=1 Tax=Devosia chinhatensis TaxID=429727 RepID=A0A0F5FKY4_9HYPH|nr:ribonuclease III [Devosia chinhatensis]KKB09220.1 ribonuclease [Devosia chinhatensis]
MSRRDKTHEKLQFRLGYRFADLDNLERALTHSSAISPAKRIERSYQRLEFLGDRVLGLVVADMLYRRYPKSNEGDLSRTLNTLVRKETCAEIARQLDLGKEMILGDSEARSGGAEKDAILGDVTEAIIGAIYLDGGLEPARSFIERNFEDVLAGGQANRADAKTTLQEWAQARGLEPPAYLLVERTGPDHAPEFTIAVNLEGFEPLQAVGHSKKFAEHKAAELFLVRQQVWKEKP